LTYCPSDIAIPAPASIFLAQNAAADFARRRRTGNDRRSLQAKARLHGPQDWAGIGRFFSDDPTFKAQFARITEGLRKAGLPEGEANKE
jgi:hypothetical protein